MKVLFSHPTGNAFVRAAAVGLLDANVLAAFYTTVATFPGNVFDRLSNLPGFNDFKRRQYAPALNSYTKTWPWIELGRIASSKFAMRDLTRHETGKFSVDSVYQSIDKRVAENLKNVLGAADDAVYAYEDGALLSFREAKHLGFKCVYDLPIGYWRTARKLLDAERERWPDWVPTLIGFGDSDKKLANKDEELHLADLIIVASSFTASTLKDYPGKLPEIKVVPYAFPPVYKDRNYTSPIGRALKLLFVGSLSQRKGIADLFAAVDLLGDKVALTVVGQKASNNCPALDTALAKHKWFSSLPHHEVLKLMREHDVLVFPSLFEGFGLVITEAMSQGTPVITTERTAGPDLITDGENGWLIEAGATLVLKQAIQKILDKPEDIERVGRAAMETAGKRSWDVYSKELADAVIKH